MKSIKEKAEAYDKVLEWATEAHKVCDGMLKEDLEHLFPELKESENKRMIQYFKDLAPFDNADELYEKYGFSHKDAIAWLEKQGEQKPSDKIEQKPQRMVSAEAKEAMYDKPAWSEEDENAIQVLKDIVRHSNEIDENIYTMSLKEKLYDWLKSLKDRVQPQPKQEWTEEDETYLDHIITAVKLYYTDYKGEENPWRNELLRWLKSLRPQNRWKPSDEQMDMLAKVCSTLHLTTGENEIMESIYDALKKLK